MSLFVVNAEVHLPSTAGRALSFTGSCFSGMMHFEVDEDEFKHDHLQPPSLCHELSQDGDILIFSVMLDFHGWSGGRWNEVCS